ncbi:hypothetical protein [Streptomyces sp. DASNCL29]|uniref:hypothetical protein n=1 Tax=Streptomyces sp. DASNCL29 TaxID=2583819 RepID=UPI00110FDBCB|nr:hypothetical protein [Streptomyces sp. DASNCL29]TMU94833.1 hypothetical protein FGK60_37395 [Streptomyces sp. DASNCL29]
MTGNGRTGGVSGNDFRGHGGAQGGSHNTQINFFGGPPRGGRQWVAIAVVALCVLGLVGVVAWVVTSSGDNGSAESSGPSPSKSPSPAPPSRAAEGAEAPAPSASLSAPTSTIQWRGKVRIAEHGPRLDKVPPKIDAGSGDLDLGLVNPPRLTAWQPDLAIWSERGMPTRQECSELVSAQGVRQVEAKVGAVVCVNTMEGRAAVLTITSISDSFTTGVTAEATVWSQSDG